MNKQFFGEDGFHFFLGVIEDTIDPEKLGRVRIRMFGIHTQDKDMIPTADLPWAIPISPVTTASIDGIGNAPVGLLNGSVVFGFWMDGTDMQHPAVLGSLPGVPITEPKGDVGFNDPEEIYPCDLDTPDVNVAARGIAGNYAGLHKATEWRIANILGGATCDGAWEEPASTSMPIYPDNSVREFKYKLCEGEDYGHVEEFDSTPGAERYLRHHKTSNNFIESHMDGTEVRKIHGPHFELNLDDKTLLVKGDWKVEVEGNKTEYIHGDYCLLIDGHYKQTVGSYKKVSVGSYFNESVIAFKSILIGGYRSEKIIGARTEWIGALDMETVIGAQINSVGVTRTTDIGVLDTLTVVGSRVSTVTIDDTLTVGGDKLSVIGGQMTIKAETLLEEIDTTSTTIATLITEEADTIIEIGDSLISMTAPEIIMTGAIGLDGDVSSKTVDIADGVQVMPVAAI